MYTIESYIEWGEEEIEVTVEFDAIPSSRGTRDKWGCQLEPDEPAYIDIVEIRSADNTKYDIDELKCKDLDRLIEACEDSLHIEDFD